MAKISQTISGGSGGGGVVAPVKMPTSGSPLAQGIGHALNVGIGLYAEQRAKEKAERQNAALASVHTDFLDAQDDAINQQQEAQAIQNQISIFNQDGDVSSDEMKMMAGLQAQLDKFDLLSPSQRQIRKNALLRQALNDPANAGIQSTISSMFGGMSIEPVQNPVQAAFEQKMDQMYGPGAWTPADAGREQGKAIYLQNVQRKAKANFTGAIADIQTASSAAASVILKRAETLISTQGFITADQAAELRLAAANTKAELYSHLTAAAKANADGVDPAAQLEAKQQVDAYFSMFTDLVTGEGNITDAYGITKQLTQLNNLTSEVIKYEAPYVMKAATSVLGGGSVGGGQSLLDMLLMLNNKTNITLLESSGADPALMAKQATSITEYIFGGTEKKVDTLVKQAGNSRLINFMAGNMVLSNVNTPDEAGKTIEVVGKAVEAGASVEDAVEALSAHPSAVNLAAQGELQESAVAMFKKSIGTTGIGEGTLQRLTIKDNQLVVGAQLEKILDNVHLGSAAKADDIRKALEPINRLLADFPTKINAADLRGSYLSTLQEQRGEPIDPRIVNVEQLEAVERGEAVFDEKIGSEVLGELPPAGGETPIPEERPVVGGTAEVEASRARIEAIRNTAPAPFDPTTGSDLLRPTDGETPVPQAESTAASRAEARAAAGVQAFNEQNPQNPTQETPTVPKAAVTKQSAPVSSDAGKKFGKADKELDTIVNTLREGITDPTSGKTIGLEGFSTSTYVPNGDKSGITIGTGIDLRHQSEQGLIKQGVPKAIAAKLRPYYGKKDKALEGQEPLSRSEIEVLDKAVVSYKLKQLKSAIPEFESFPDALKLGLYKAKHQYGAFDSFNLKSQAVRNDVRAAIGNLMTWTDSTKDVGGNIARKYQVMGELAADATPSMIMQLLRTASEEYKKDISSLGSDLLR